MACVDWLMMWYSCMSREVPLVGHTNISIDDYCQCQKNASFVAFPKLIIPSHEPHYHSHFKQVLLFVEE
jgi:hypothetical protein